MSYRVVFLGTPTIAASCLQALIDKHINVVGVVTRPDKPQGRNKQIMFSAVKQLALKHHIPILQPNKMIENYDELARWQPDLIVACAYGALVPEKILNLPKFKCVNIHTSLLPRWRGGAPIHYAILNSDQCSGISLMYMSKALDTGDIIYQKAINLSPDETYTSLYQRLCSLAYDILGEKIDTLFNINLVTKKQDESQATYAKNISRTDELIDWNKPANKVDAKIRGLYEQPIAYSVYQNYNVKIHQAKLTTNQSSLTPGAISKIDGSGIYVATNSNDICLTKIQLPGKRPITIKELLNGNHPFKVNSKFTS